ncbi:MAG: hypothetical protein P4L49_16570 [Desulfosporosinus sp.]|nr:hypothetical protein [Desulfosporosinus sp.]
MGKKIKFDNKVLFELEIINGEEFLVKEDKVASKRAGRPVYVMKPLHEIIKSDKPVIYLK